MRNMEQPTLAMATNLRWTKDGVVWADYILQNPIPYGYRPDADKGIVRTLHTMLIRALPGESLLLSLAAPQTSESVVAASVEGIDLDTHPDWAEESAARLDELDTFKLGERVYWLSIPLSTSSLTEKLKAAGHSTWTSLSDYVGLPRTDIPTDEIESRAHQADRIIADIPAVFEPTPATPTQMVWLWNHCIRRGLDLNTEYPKDPPTDDHTKRATALTPVALDEGAQSDRLNPASQSWWKSLHSATPKLSRVLKVDTPDDLTASSSSYQVMMTLADMPAGGVLFPGSEFFTLADDVPGLDVDFACRLRTKPQEEALRANKRALRALNEQFTQREGELTTGHTILDTAAEALAEYTSLLESDHDEVEVAWTAIFAVGADSEEQATVNARQLVKAFENQRYRLSAPIGKQEELWWAMVPGIPSSQIVREFTQITTSTHFAAYVPIISNRLGDAEGPVLALNITSNRVSAVHNDIAGKSLRDISGAFAVTGELGSGKSVTLKTIGDQVVDLGGQVIAIDQTDLGEYAIWAEAITDAVVQDLADADYSLDPLRLFEPDIAADIALSVLLPLLRIKTSSDMGITLADALSVEYRESHEYIGLAGLTDHLLSDECTLTKARELGKAIGVFRRLTYAAALFDDTLPPLPLNARAIVFRTHRVELPSKLQTEQEHLWDNLPPEKQFGHVVYALIAKLARTQCFADPDQLALFAVDESHHLTESANDVGIGVIIDFIKQGRKSSAITGLGDQDCQFGDEVLRGLIKTRIAHRHTDKNLAKRALEWIGLDPTDPDLLKEYTEQTSPATGRDRYVEAHRRGEAYFRDSSGGIGRIKVLPPSAPARRLAASTTPKKKEHSQKGLVRA